MRILEKINCWQFGNFLHDRKLCDSNMSQIDGNLYSLELHLQAVEQSRVLSSMLLNYALNLFSHKNRFCYRSFSRFSCELNSSLEFFKSFLQREETQKIVQKMYRIILFSRKETTKTVCSLHIISHYFFL